MDFCLFGLKLLVWAALGLGLGSEGSMLLKSRVSGVIGKNVTFQTSISSSEQFVVVTWSKDGQPIITMLSGQDKVAVEEGYPGRVSYDPHTCQLRLGPLVKEDAGQYSLTVVTRKPESLISNVLLEVLEPVSDVQIRSSVSEAVELNSTVVLTCSARGSFSYRWINGSEPVRPDGEHLKTTDDQLTISHVWRSDLRGPIYCVAENALESGRSSAFNLSVSYGPEGVVMTHDLQGSVLEKGSNLTLQCSANSDPPALLQWLFNGEAVPQGAQLSPAVRTLRGVTQEHSGNYSCRAFNSKTGRSSASSTTPITVLEALSGTNISASLWPLVVGNSSLSLWCWARAGVVESAEWLKDGERVRAGERVTLSADGTRLNITTLMKTDAGEYTCRLSNRVNTDHASYTPVIHYGPEGVVMKGQGVVRVAGVVVLSCSADSLPPPVFRWTLNDSLLNTSASELHITSATPADSGTYRCQALNPVTGVTRAATHTLTITEEEAVQEGLSGGAVAAIVISVIVLLLIIICCCRRKKKTPDIPSPY